MNVEEAPQAHGPDLVKNRPLERAHLTTRRRTQVLPERAAAPLISALGGSRTFNEMCARLSIRVMPMSLAEGGDGGES